MTLFDLNELRDNHPGGWTWDCMEKRLARVIERLGRSTVERGDAAALVEVLGARGALHEIVHVATCYPHVADLCRTHAQQCGVIVDPEDPGDIWGYVREARSCGLDDAAIVAMFVDGQISTLSAEDTVEYVVRVPDKHRKTAWVDTGRWPDETSRWRVNPHQFANAKVVRAYVLEKGTGWQPLIVRSGDWRFEAPNVYQNEPYRHPDNQAEAVAWLAADAESYARACREQAQYKLATEIKLRDQERAAKLAEEARERERETLVQYCTARGRADLAAAIVRNAGTWREEYARMLASEIYGVEPLSHGVFTPRIERYRDNPELAAFQIRHPDKPVWVTDGQEVICQDIDVLGTAYRVYVPWRAWARVHDENWYRERFDDTDDDTDDPIPF